jgi:hypothetical protein
MVLTPLLVMALEMAAKTDKVVLPGEVIKVALVAVSMEMVKTAERIAALLLVDKLT